MKRTGLILALCFLVLLVCLSVCGCNDKKGKEDSPTSGIVVQGDDAVLDAKDIFGDDTSSDSSASATDGNDSSGKGSGASSSEKGDNTSSSSGGLVLKPNGEIDYEAKENWTKPVGGDKK